MEIDDRWQSAYGDLEFDSAKFPDAPGMVRQLHAMGFKVTVWVMPFVEENSAAYRYSQLPRMLTEDFPVCLHLMPHLVELASEHARFLHLPFMLILAGCQQTPDVWRPAVSAGRAPPRATL